MVTISPEFDLQRAIAAIIDPGAWTKPQPILTNNMCYRREDSTEKAVAILALIKELV